MKAREHVWLWQNQRRNGWEHRDDSTMNKMEEVADIKTSSTKTCAHVTRLTYYGKITSCELWGQNSPLAIKTGRAGPALRRKAQTPQRAKFAEKDHLNSIGNLHPRPTTYGKNKDRGRYKLGLGLSRMNAMETAQSKQTMPKVRATESRPCLASAPHKNHKVTKEGLEGPESPSAAPASFVKQTRRTAYYIDR